ncbi:ArsA family ATPase [Janibacter sp. G1551]|uniref:ArsA family ATPase n=1 Tax=Janibacter sp. G1551 TaxID=3420440 RepID=UPI003CFD30A2
MSPQIVLYTGKGGVGKTTVAAATAAGAARAGLRTLVLSTDPAHSLGDALGVDLAHGDGEPVPIEAGLDGLHVTRARRVEPGWDVVRGYLEEVLDRLGVDPVLASELTSLPGADEMAGLLELGERARTGTWDLIILDCAPTTETLRLLSLPEAAARQLGRLVPVLARWQRVLSVPGGPLVGIPQPSKRVLDAVRVWQDDMLGVRDVLTGPEARIRLVTTPERMVIAEARRTWTTLSLLGYGVDAVVVNRVLPEADGEGVEPGWLAGWNAAQAKGLDDIADSFAGLAQPRVPYLPEEPVGVAALVDAWERMEHLGDLGSEAGTGAPERGAPGRAAGGLTIEPDGDGFRLRLPLPFVTAGEVHVERTADEMVLEVAGHRRVIVLPAVLRRCDVARAGVRRGVLTLHFVPNPQEWPDGSR